MYMLWSIVVLRGEIFFFRQINLLYFLFFFRENQFNFQKKPFRSLVDRKYAFEALKEAGAYLSTSERIILGLAPDAAHPKFRQLQKIVMTSAEDTGLL